MTKHKSLKLNSNPSRAETPKISCKMVNVLRRKKKRLTVVALLLSSTCLLFYILTAGILTTSLQSEKDRGELSLPVDINNYLKVKGRRKMLVELPTCQIPLEVEVVGEEENNQVISESMVSSVQPGLQFQFLPKLKKFENTNQSERDKCKENRPQFTLVKSGNILMLTSESEFMGVSCCFRGIRRVRGFDNQTEISEDCISIPSSARHHGLVIKSVDGILVSCKHGHREYVDYHALIQNKRTHLDLNSASEIQKSNAIPNILIIGLDSVSRYHFEQLMPKTRIVLKELGVIEMDGYAKVGLNTFPNAVPFFTGYSEDDVSQFCYERNEPIDNCPFIWHNLTKAVSTAFIEDAPGLSIFNYFKFGFQHQPTDYYLRPLMLRAAETHRFTFPCVGSRSTEAFVLDYIEQLHELKSPLFLFTWLTSLAHEGFDDLPAADLLFSSFFKKLNLQNTILIFMSDHGLRFGDSRRTFNGWFNSKLPFFTVTLPQGVKTTLGVHKIRNLKENSKKLTTPYDFYHTMIDILNTYHLKPKETTTVFKNGKEYSRKYGQSLFTSIPVNRTCSEAGIPKQFCPCSNLEEMQLSSRLIQTAAISAVETINGWLPKSGKCKRLQVDLITAAAKLNREEFTVGFRTTPGGSHFEAVARIDGQKVSDSENGTLRETITRLNKVNFDRTSCVNDWFLELYCECDLFYTIIEYLFGA